MTDLTELASRLLTVYVLYIVLCRNWLLEFICQGYTIAKHDMFYDSTPILNKLTYSTSNGVAGNCPGLSLLRTCSRHLEFHWLPTERLVVHWRFGCNPVQQTPTSSTEPRIYQLLSEHLSKGITVVWYRRLFHHLLATLNFLMISCEARIIGNCQSVDQVLPL